MVEFIASTSRWAIDKPTPLSREQLTWLRAIEALEFFVQDTGRARAAEALLHPFKLRPGAGGDPHLHRPRIGESRRVWSEIQENPVQCIRMPLPLQPIGHGEPRFGALLLYVWEDHPLDPAKREGLSLVAPESFPLASELHHVRRYRGKAERRCNRGPIDFA